MRDQRSVSPTSTNGSGGSRPVLTNGDAARVLNSLEADIHPFSPEQNEETDLPSVSTIPSTSRNSPLNGMAVNPEETGLTSEVDVGWSRERNVDLSPQDSSAYDIEARIKPKNMNLDEATRVRLDTETQYLNDGKRRVDFILAYQPGPPDDANENKKVNKREEFERNLRKEGLYLEEEGMEKSQDGRTCFVKLHAPWEFLARQAEIMKIRMPIRVNDSEKDPIRSCLDSILKSFNPFELEEELKLDEPDYFTAAFSQDRQHQFIMQSKETFFSNSDRSRMVWDVLNRVQYDPSNHTRIGVRRLIKNGSYCAAYPLHEGDTHIHENNANRNDRQLLYDTWAKPRRFYKYQPLDLIRKYYGEKIALYFSWLGFYTKAIIPAALIGIICVIYGAITIYSDVPSVPNMNFSVDICNPEGAGNLTMCPNCDHGCAFWKLQESCLYARGTHIFDNLATVLFAVVMSIWATLFLEGWKRYHAELAWDWDLTDFELEEEQIRPDFVTKVRGKRKNPITHKEEPFLPFLERVLRLCTSTVAVVFFLCLVLVFVFGVICYRVIVVHVLYRRGWDQATLMTSITAACLNLIAIMILGRVYQSLAWRLTSWEFPRTEMEFENSYTLKVFMFQFLNYYSSLFYIAFFKGKWGAEYVEIRHAIDQATNTTNRTVNVPGTATAEENTIFGYPPEQCNPAGCMVELVIQLAIVMVGKQFINNGMEIMFPIVYNWWRARSHHWESEDNSYTRWEKDFALNPVPPMFLFNEYLEMVIQYGFITLFVAAFPLAPLFALINNIMEIRLDAYKFVVAYRRPKPVRVKDLGVWDSILDGISKIAVLTNACVIAFTSDFVPRMLYSIVNTENNNSLEGFVEDSMSYVNCSNISAFVVPENNPLIPTNPGICRFRAYRKPPCGILGPEVPCGTNYEPSLEWWHILAAKLAFVLVFEHLVFFIKGSVSYIIPDVPHHIVLQMQREEYLAKMARVEFELEKQQNASRQSQPASPTESDLRQRNLMSNHKNHAANGPAVLDLGYGFGNASP